MPKKKYFTEEERKAAQRETWKRYREKNRDEKLAKRRKRYAENREKEIERGRKWCEDNPIKARALSRLNSYNQEDKKHHRGKGDLTMEWIIENIFSKPCAHCGKTGWDIIGCNRLDNSKPHTKDNVEPCCKDCNDKMAAIWKKTYYAERVDQIEKVTGEVVNQWLSSKEAEKIGGFNSGAIIACANGRKSYHTHKGHIWKKPL